MDSHPRTAIRVLKPSATKVIMKLLLLVVVVFSTQAKAEWNMEHMYQHNIFTANQLQNFFTKTVSETNISIMPIEQATGVAVTLNMKYSIWFPNNGHRGHLRFISPEEFFLQ